MEPAISFRETGIRYRRWRRNRHRTALRRGGVPRTHLWGIRDVTFEVGRGAYVGVIGANGAGKTTLLLAGVGVLQPDEGVVHVRGRAAAVLGVGTGLVPQLTGWDNVELISVLLGLSSREARDLAPEIAAFSGLGDFLDSPVRTYSAGMRARLGFSVVVHCGADVLLLDEVRAVGDEEFRERSAVRLQELREAGCTILMATHDLDAITETADRVAWLDHGALIDIGAPAAVVSRYRATIEHDPGLRPPHRTTGADPA
jgi:ABC-2 type transport system ATP-binding protein